MLTNTERAWLRLHLTRGLGRSGLFKLHAQFESPVPALSAVEVKGTAIFSPHRARINYPVAEDDPRFIAACDTLEKCQARIISFWDEEYPSLLRTIHDPPALIYLRGTLDIDQAVGVVGSRRASTQGERTTWMICSDLARSGITIVSGMARGIDGVAHEAALAAGGTTIAVLGCGIDRIYPYENRKLYQQIPEQGAVISEYPPGTKPLAGHFPGRNRIISGLSRGVLIVEAAEGSGSLITADFALDQGREVFAVPGAIQNPNSRGVNRLLKDGAHLVTGASDIVEIVRPSTTISHRQGRPESPELLNQKEKTIIEQLGDEPVQVDDLARKSGLTPTELSAILLQLELRGTVSQLPGMRYIAAFRST
ncbi:MAG: DNA-protecting protein DprA [Desulfuromonas sp.]|nr:MAG: DNA-protecting protein DprA [Desulfuromonas sp.]